jgi:hypothetical protein
MQEPASAPVRKSRPKRSQEASPITNQSSDGSVIALMKRVKELERWSFTILGRFNSRTATNFFKYSNVRRY